MLAFFTTNWDRLSREPSTLIYLYCVLGFMFASLLVSVLTGLLAYLTQNTYSRMAREQELEMTYPYLRDTPAAEKLRRSGSRLEACTIFTGVLSLVLLCVGAGFFYLVVQA